jgi:hypothetical protein
MEQLVDELHKPARRHFPRRKVATFGIDDLWQADLVEMIPFSRINQGYKYLLTVIDTFSKVARAIPIKSKKGKDVTAAFAKTLKKSKPRNLQTDWGKEFYNSQFKDLMAKHDINHYSTYSDLRASIVERFNRTLKSRMYKLFTLKGNRKWVTALPQLLKQYNSTYHRSINARPVDVNAKLEKNIRNRLLVPPPSDGRPSKLKVGDKVRISKIKSILDKGYLQNWTNEVFIITKVDRTFIPFMYVLKDELGEPIAGKFYKEELQKISSDSGLYLIEKVLKKRKNKDGTLQYYVKWKGLDKKYNSWVNNLTTL